MLYPMHTIVSMLWTTLFWAACVYVCICGKCPLGVFGVFALLLFCHSCKTASVIIFQKLEKKEQKMVLDKDSELELMLFDQNKIVSYYSIFFFYFLIAHVCYHLIQTFCVHVFVARILVDLQASELQIWYYAERGSQVYMNNNLIIFILCIYSYFL